MESAIVTALFSLPESCVIAFVNEQDKKVQILYSTRMIEQALPKFMAQVRNDAAFKDIKEDIPKLRLEVLEQGGKLPQLKIQYSHWARRYKLEGYTEYRPRKVAPLLYSEWRIRLAEFHKYIVATVWLFNNNGNKTKLVGAFGTMEEAEAWCRATFPPDRLIEPIIASNALSKAFYDYTFPKRRFFQKQGEDRPLSANEETREIFPTDLSAKDKT